MLPTNSLFLLRLMAGSQQPVDLEIVGRIQSLFLRDDSPVQVRDFGFFGVRPGLATCLQ